MMTERATDHGLRSNRPELKSDVIKTNISAIKETNEEIDAPPGIKSEQLKLHDKQDQPKDKDFKYDVEVDLREHATKSVYIHDIKDKANKNHLIYPDNKYF